MGISYKDAGVDTKRGQAQVSLIKDLCKATFDDRVMSSIGGFGAMYDLSGICKEPVLVAGTDGVGTKVIIAQEMDDHKSLGIDLVAMCANDIICQGARPLVFLDYIATGYLDPEKMAHIVEGIAKGCQISGMSLIGGETAEMPGLYQNDQYDLAGFALGIVDKEDIIDGSDLQSGDVLIGLESSGIHSNGLSLARKIVFDHMNFHVDTYVEDLGRTIGEELLEPTRIYVKDILDLLEKVQVKALVHNTGGGLYENIPRVLGDKLDAEIDLSSHQVPAIFELLQEWASVDTKEMYSTFNMGIGMVVAVSREDADKVIDHFKDYKAFRIGQIGLGSGELRIDY